MRTEPSVKVQLIDGLYEAKKWQPIWKFEFIGRKMLITVGCGNISMVIEIAMMTGIFQS